VTPQAFADLMDRAYVQMRPWSANTIAETLSNPHCIFLPHDHGGLIAQIVADECEILALATDPQAQRTGIASSLLCELIRTATEKSATRIFLDVAAQNTQARAFYAARGFARIGKRKAYYNLRDGTKDDALLLSRPVPLGQVAEGPDTPKTATKSG
jgi:ribosomal-protein-alanine N-acetyltransferase